MDGKQQAEYLQTFIETFQDAAAGDDHSRDAIADVMGLNRQDLEDAKLFDRQLQAIPETESHDRTVMHLLATGNFHPEVPYDVPIAEITGSPKYIAAMQKRIGIDQWRKQATNVLAFPISIPTLVAESAHPHCSPTFSD